MFRSKLFLTIAVASFSCLASVGQTADSTGPLSLESIQTWKMRSSIIGEDYTIYVLKTDNYDTTHDRLPVLYLTDGDWNMTVAKNCFSMLRQDYVTHEPLVVGIGYGKNENKRFRDLDPQTGGPKFLSFIEKEVMPFIDRQYRTNSERAVYGYSMGGMFTTYILFNRPDLFQKIFIGAPGNNGSGLMPAAREYFKTHDDLKSKVFIGVGGFEHAVVRNIDSFTNFLTAKKIPGFEIESAVTPKAGHGAALAQVMQNAIAFGYCDKHKKIGVTTSSLKRFAGRYVFYEDNKEQAEATISVRNGKLYMTFKGSNGLSDELMPYAENEFFVEANELMTFKFQDDGLVVNVVNDKDYHFVKK